MPDGASASPASYRASRDRLGIHLTLTQSGSSFWNGLLQIATALFVLVLLYGGRSDAFFARGRPPGSPRS